MRMLYYLWNKNKIQNYTEMPTEYVIKAIKMNENRLRYNSCFVLPSMISRNINEVVNLIIEKDIFNIKSINQC